MASLTANSSPTELNSSLGCKRQGYKSTCVIIRGIIMITYFAAMLMNVQAREMVEVKVLNLQELHAKRQPVNSSISIDIEADHDLNRVSRSAAAGVVDYTGLHPEECARQVAAAKSKHDGQMALLVKLGHDVILPCHHCTPEVETAMNWYRLQREVGVEAGGTVWHPEELELDKYDNELLNRVFVNPSHQLIIRDFQPDDVGTYFCMRYSEKDERRLKTLAFRSAGSVGGGAAGAAFAWSTVKDKGKMDMVVHVDIELPRKEILVTKSGHGYPKPQPRRVDEDRNVKVVTHWEPWSDCSTCGAPGERRRRGSCFVHIVDRQRPASPPHLDHALRFFPRGLPCQSSLLTSRDLSDIAARTPEVELERCDVICKDKARGKSGFFKLVSISGNKKKKTKKVDKKSFRRQEGDNLQLFCIGSKDDSAVQWSNGSVVLDTLSLPSTTSGRVSVGADNALYIRFLRLSDAGVYSCTSGDLTHARYAITVTSRPGRPEDAGEYMRYLGLCYAADLIIFLVCMAVRHKQRLVQVRKKGDTHDNRKRKQLKPAHNDTDSVSSSLSSGGATSDVSSD